MVSRGLTLFLKSRSVAHGPPWNVKAVALAAGEGPRVCPSNLSRVGEGLRCPHEPSNLEKFALRPRHCIATPIYTHLMVHGQLAARLGRKKGTLSMIPPY